uniref:Uncharacterized protein n=1 Tax=Ditylenchus dipsaci TaxID=166011 RepID=A0A915E9B7_9BILA
MLKVISQQNAQDLEGSMPLKFGDGWRVSSQAYNEIEDEFQGSNLLFIADSSFSKIDVKEIGSKGMAQGVSQRSNLCPAPTMI